MPVTHHRYPGALHGTATLTRSWDQARIWQRDAARALASAHGGIRQRGRCRRDEESGTTASRGHCDHLRRGDPRRRQHLDRFAHAQPAAPGQRGDPAARDAGHRRAGIRAQGHGGGPGPQGGRPGGVLAPFTSYASYARRLNGVLKEAEGDATEIVVYDQPSAASTMSPLLSSLPVTHRLDGLLIMGLPLDDALAERLLAQRLPTVLIDSARPELDSITTDDEAAGHLVARHLIQRGRRTIAYVTESQRSTDYLSQGQRRRAGVERAFTAAGLDPAAMRGSPPPTTSTAAARRCGRWSTRASARRRLRAPRQHRGRRPARVPASGHPGAGRARDRRLRPDRALRSPRTSRPSGSPWRSRGGSASGTCGRPSVASPRRRGTSRSASNWSSDRPPDPARSRSTATGLRHAKCFYRIC